MKDQVPTNPHRDSDLQELYRACQKRAAELMARDGISRTAEQREELALDTAHLLLATAATLINTDIATPTSSIWDDARRDPVTAFWPKHEAALRAARYRTLVGAVDAVLGGKREHWIRDAHVDGYRAYDLALSSEDGLLKVLEHLDHIQAGRR